MNQTANTQVKPLSSGTIKDTLSELYDNQRQAFIRQEKASLEERLEMLKTLSRLIKHYRLDLCQAERSDFYSKSAEEVTLTEILPLLEHIRYVRTRLARWMRPQKCTMPLHFKPGNVAIHFEPLGCVGIISPWNYPIILALSPLIDALSAGNNAMIKLSEHTPQTAKVITQLLSEAFTPERVVAVTGDADTAKAFVALPFDHLLYTGSTPIGKEVMARAAENLTPVTLELGGKSPCVLGQTQNFERSVKKIAFGKCINAGQTCIAPDVLFCPQDKVESFSQLFFEAVAQMYPGNLCDTDYTSIINAQHFTRLTELVAETQKSTVQSYCQTTAEMVKQRCFPPTLVFNPNENNRLWQEEIFGPILIVKTYADPEEVITHLRNWVSPLAIYIFSDNSQEIDRITRHTRSGSICVNETLIQYGIDDAPFGGVGPSGFGRYHGFEGFKTFSNPRTIVQKPNSGLSQLLFPPFGNRLQRMAMRLFMR